MQARHGKLDGALLVGVYLIAAVSTMRPTSRMDPLDNTTQIINNKADNTGTKNDTLVRNPLLGDLLAGSLIKNVPLPAAITDSTHPPLTLYFDNNSMQDLWIALTSGKS